MHVQHELVSHPIPALLRKLAVPAGTGFFFNTMFNVVDTFYAGQVSTEALAALSLSFPVFFLIIANGSGISTGTTALIGHALGGGNREEARLLASQGISFALANSVLVTIVGLLSAPHLFRIMGAGGTTLSLAVSYISPLFVGSVFFIINFVLNAILNATGDSRSYRNFLICSFLVNLVLDPWFLFGSAGIPPLGVAGISWSTVVVQFLGNCYLLRRVAKSGMLAGFRWWQLIPQGRAYLALAQQGFPSGLNVLTIASGIFVITWFIGRFGGSAVAAYGIGTRIEQLALLPALGMNVAVLALVAQNSGAGKVERVMQTIRLAYGGGSLFMLLGTGLIYLCAAPLMELFTSDPAVIATGVSFLRIECFVLIAYSILYSSVSALQGLRRPLFPLVIGMVRQVVLPVPVFFLFAESFGWGLYGVWWGFLVITWIAAVVSLWFVGRTVDSLVGRRGALYGMKE
ncbi:MATE family efflux transporter [Geomonas sp. RF6]|uniref:MATE family efflux transporter n=1 Tax=Geomonas sp. RF6 TaxID=2897342 RepID=UPI001E4DB3F4|nr:MATE family efflux transporter [Geomonas sp. RF6]UFS72295.1 MATE family efflux transporter [Geomonas sp. RF6]